ncbi:MAG: hypothetical protein QXL19_07660 [Ignisphaera sp.]
MFEARYLRFSSIKSLSIMNENLYGPLQVRHAIYLMFSILFIWRGISTGNMNSMLFGLVTIFICFLSSLSGYRSMSFEAKIIMTLYSILDSAIPSKSETNRRKDRKMKQPRKKIDIGKVLERKKIDIGKVLLICIVYSLSLLSIFISITSSIDIVYKLFIVLSSITLMLMMLYVR